MTDTRLPVLPVGLFSFERIRTAQKLYVDKTGLLVRLADESERCFLSRPRRFGKSLMISTLDAMFRGKVELFRGLAAENWVEKQAEHPNPILGLDFSEFDDGSPEELDLSLSDELARIASKKGISIVSRSLGGVFKDVVVGLYERQGPVVVLIDEYDKPVLDYIGQPEKAEAMRQKLRSFYTLIKG